MSLRSLRNHYGLQVGLCAALMLLVAAPSALGQRGAPAEGDDSSPISMNLRDAYLRDLLPLLADTADLNLILGPGVSVQVPFLTLRAKSPEEIIRVLKVFVEAEGYYWREEAGVHIVTANPPAQMPAEARPGAEPSGSQLAPLSAPEAIEAASAMAEPPPTPEVHFDGIVLKYVDVADVARMFGGRISQTTPSPGQLAHMQRRVASRPTARSGIRPQTYLQNPFGPLSYPVEQFGGDFDDDYGISGGGGFGGGMGGGFGGMGGFGGGLVELLPGEMLPPLAYMPLNTLIVQGTQAELDAFREIVALLDVAPRQVEISTQFIEVEANIFEAFGLEWTTSGGNWDILTGGTGLAGNLLARFASDNFRASLGLALTRSKGRIVNAPRIVTLNNQFAEFSVTTDIPYFVPETQVTQGVVTTTFTPLFIPVVNGLFVTPRINADDTISMWLEPELTDQVGLVVAPDGSTPVPITSSQYASALVRVPDGDTAVIGGLVRRNDTESMVGIPFLSELPIIGKLFRRKEINKSDRELLIFVTPRIIRERGGGLETSL